MSKFHEVLNNIIINPGKDRGDFFNRIFVVSAYNNVTNWLLEHKKTKEPGIYQRFVNNENYSQTLDELLDKLIEINKTFVNIKLDLQPANDFITNRILQAKNYLISLEKVLATGYVNRQTILLAAREILSSIGEAHAAFNSVNILENNGIHAEFVDLCGFDDAEYLTIDERIHKAFRHIDCSSSIPFVTGYTKGTEGIMREFDRGYSEVTFCKVAVEVKAEEAIIHKEFHLSSADPNIVGIEKSIPVGFTNFNVADQLADIGMEAIHPKASKPLEMAGINIRIKNTFEPEHPGTLISKNYEGERSKVEIISGTAKVTAIEIHDPLMVGQVGFDRSIMERFEYYKVSYILKATNANSITMVIWDEDLYEELIREFKETYYEVTVKPVALVCTLGTNIAQPGIIARATLALAQNNINIEAISQSMKQVNMQFVIARKDYKKAIIALNETLCLEND